MLAMPNTEHKEQKYVIFEILMPTTMHKEHKVFEIAMPDPAHKERKYGMWFLR